LVPNCRAQAIGHDDTPAPNLTVRGYDGLPALSSPESNCVRLLTKLDPRLLQDAFDQLAIKIDPTDTESGLVSVVDWKPCPGLTVDAAKLDPNQRRIAEGKPLIKPKGAKRGATAGHQPFPARLIPGESLAVDQDYAMSRTCREQCGGRTAWAGADDGEVRVHRSMVCPHPDPPPYRGREN
jgi:hypothetical protein